MGNAKEIRVNGVKVAAKLETGWWELAGEVAGKATVELK